ncbi:hypothetical protein [Streptomyces sp. Tu 3180]|uniref:hypothetical protein n=1 Tax=Streptomyces sp. Tu 3180 TaxID=2682611 RepID=UPI00135B5163|nr:hypothetical protein [Streptomyces sp. Tu 3180]KAF3463428.1 hypothetical protein GL259_03215 [Streptomyces sp. Tu 3180]
MHSVIRRALMFVVLSAVSAATTACGPAAGSTSESRPSPAGQRPLTKAQLAEALPDGGELPGFTTVPQSMALLEAEDVVTADRPSCRPIADMMSVRPKHPRKAVVWATMKPDGAAPEAAPGSVTLTSHTGQDAETWMAELREALTECRGFTARSQRGWTHRFSVRPLAAARTGDDSVTYLLTNVLSPDGKGNVMTVVRTGGVFATYLMNEDAEVPVPVPASVASRQHKKLRAAAARR